MTSLPASAIRIGTRGSTLARAQSTIVADALSRATGRETVLVLIRTEGDVSTAPLAQLGGTGVFVSALREALLRSEIDLAVHSLKDLPTAAAEGIALAAVPPREDPRDVRRRPRRAHPRRAAAGRPRRHRRTSPGGPARGARAWASTLVGVRGNVDTRMRKVAEGELDAVVLARAGLARLGRARGGHRGARPAPGAPRPRAGRAGRGVPRRQRAAARGPRRPSTTPRPAPASRPSAPCSPSSRPGCSAPVGALAEVAEGDHGDELWVRAVALSPDGALSVRRSASGPLDDPSAPARSWPPRCSPRAQLT